MTPDKEPFLQVPISQNRQGQRPGMLQLIPSLANAWVNKQDEIRQSIDKVKDYLIQINTSTPGDEDEAMVKDAFTHFASSYDPEYGGFGRAPKFPSTQSDITITVQQNI